MPINIGSGTGNVTYSNGNFYDSSGNLISGVASYTWAQFTAAEFDTSIARYVHVSDRHSTTDGTSTPGSLWRIDPSAASERKRNLMSGPIYFATLVSAPSPSSYPTLQIYPDDVKAPLKSNGTSYRAISRSPIVLGNVYNVAKAATKTDEESILSFSIPIDAGGKSLLQTGDQIIVDYHIGKTGVAQTFTRVFRLGTSASVLTNTILDTYTTGAAASIGVDDRTAFRVLSATSIKREGPSGSQTFPGVNSTVRNSAVTVTSLDSALSYFSASFMLVSGTADTLTMETMTVSILHAA